jgi:dTDP-4-dehydrorhamnose reductase
MKVLVTGAGGQLGHDMVASCEAAGDDVVAATHADMDVGDRDAVLGAIGTVAPDAVVHAAAWTAVDACEGDPDRALRVNALGTRHVAEACRRTGAHLLYVSTDYVFDGTKDEPYDEWDRPNPQSVYGRSKRAGECEALAQAPGAAVVRVSWVMGEHGHNMVKTVLSLADRPELAFVDDQRGCPTFTADLAPAIRRLVSSRLPGVFHVTNQGAVTWYEFVRAVLESAGHDPAKVRPIKTVELDPPRPAPRPANSVLDNAALRLSGLPLLPHYRDSLDRLVARLTA